jgi:cyclase
MNKLRKILLLTVTALGLLATTSLSYSQGNFAGVELSITPVAGNVYMIQRPGGGGNIGVQVGPDGVLLVDSLFAPLTDRLVGRNSVSGQHPYSY